MQIKDLFIFFMVLFIFCVLAADSWAEDALPGTGNGNESDDQYLSGRYSFYAERYNDFVKGLNLSDKETKKLYELISKYRSSYDLELMSKNKTLEERMQSIQKSREERENNLRDFLGHEDFIAFKQYKDTIAERFIVKSFIKMLGPDNQLDDETKEELILAMYEARLRFDKEFIPNYTDRDRPDDVPAPVYKKYLRYKEYLAAAKKILTEPEIEVFEETMKQKNAEDLQGYNWGKSHRDRVIRD